MPSVSRWTDTIPRQIRLDVLADKDNRLLLPPLCNREGAESYPDCWLETRDVPSAGLEPIPRMGSFYDEDGGEIQWKFFHLLHSLQDQQGLKLGDKFSPQQLEYQNHKMNGRLAAQTLSSSVKDASQFLDVSMKLPHFKNSGPTVNFTELLTEHLTF